MINDYTTEGKYYRLDIESSLKPLEDNLYIEYNEDTDRDTLLCLMKELPPDSIVLVGSYFRDKNGQYFSQNDMKRVLEKDCSVPIVALYATDLPYNSIGGKCVDYEKYGELIASMLKRLLDGETIENIPIISDSEDYSRWVFNKLIMDKFAIKEKTLPGGAYVMNKKPSIWEVDSKFAFTMIFLLIASATIIALTQIYRHKDKIMKVKLRETALAAEEASRMKSVFLANTSHEIRTPMNGIIGFCELALDDDISPKTRDYLSKIKQSAECLLQIINDILDLSKIEAGKIKLEYIPFDLHEVLRICQVITMPKALEKGITMLFCDVPVHNIKLLGDPTRLRQALLNLLSNAIKFTETGSVGASTVITENLEDSITLHFEIKDSGIGMSPEQINRIFEPFSQADESTTRKYGGTGLGLTITKNIIELMGGELKVESTPGLGSIFSFDLTFKKMDVFSDTFKENTDLLSLQVKPPILSKGQQINQIVVKPTFHGEVLVCEDNAISQQVICDHLIRVGLHTTIATNGKEGVDIVHRNMKSGKKPFDLIFMDIHMPVMDGLEAAKKLTLLGNKAPVIVFTANIMHSHKGTYRIHGIHDCLAKPFTAQELFSCLLKYLTPVKTTEMVLDITKEIDVDEKLNKQLLISFVKDNQTTFDDISTAVNEGHIKLAKRLVHTLKGVAGLIGKAKLREVADTIEHSLDDGKIEVTTEQMSTLEIELNAALSQYAPLLNQSKCKKLSTLEKSKAIELLNELDLLLKCNNYDCLDFIDSLMAIPNTEALIENIEKFDFVLARETLASIKRALEDKNE